MTGMKQLLFRIRLTSAAMLTVYLLYAGISAFTFFEILLQSKKAADNIYTFDSFFIIIIQNLHTGYLLRRACFRPYSGAAQSVAV